MRCQTLSVGASRGNPDTADAYSALDDAFHAGWGAEGDAGRRMLLNPTILRMIGDVQGRRVLDAGCGNGYLSRLLARRGAGVVGVDSASGPLSYARRLEQEEPLGIEYLQMDLSRLGDFGGPFYAVVANMVFLDIPEWRSALASCVDALEGGGVLVYSLTHPVWVPGRYDEWVAKGHVEVSEYLNEYEQVVSVGVNFHRPLSAYVNETIRLGCDLLELAEPRLLPEQMESADQAIFTRIPNFVVVAARRRREHATRSHNA